MPIFYSAKDDSAHYVEDDNTAFGAIGLPDIPTNFVSHKVEMQRGDELIFFTDGVTEARNEGRKFFGEQRLLRTLSAAGGRAEQGIESVYQAVREYAGEAAPSDDITMLELVYYGSSERMD